MFKPTINWLTRWLKRWLVTRKTTTKIQHTTTTRRNHCGNFLQKATAETKKFVVLIIPKYATNFDHLDYKSLE